MTKIELIEKGFSALDICLYILRKGVKEVEEFEKNGRVEIRKYDPLYMVIFGVAQSSEDFVKNCNNMDIFLAAMWCEKELSIAEFMKYINKLSSLKSEYKSFKDGRSEDLKTLMA